MPGGTIFFEIKTSVCGKNQLFMARINCLWQESIVYRDDFLLAFHSMFPSSRATGLQTPQVIKQPPCAASPPLSSATCCFNPSHSLSPRAVTFASLPLVASLPLLPPPSPAAAIRVRFDNPPPSPPSHQYPFNILPPYSFFYSTRILINYPTLWKLYCYNNKCKTRPQQDKTERNERTGEDNQIKHVRPQSTW
eukprot:768783-Hanusia_phi.AAC.7